MVEPPGGSTDTAKVAPVGEAPTGIDIVAGDVSTSPIGFGVLSSPMYQSSRLRPAGVLGRHRHHQDLARRQVDADEQRRLVAATVDGRDVALARCRPDRVAQIGDDESGEGPPAMEPSASAAMRQRFARGLELGRPHRPGGRRRR